MLKDYKSVIARHDQKTADKDTRKALDAELVRTYTILLTESASLSPTDLARTLREIGSRGIELDDDEGELALRCQLASRQGYAECGFPGWGDGFCCSLTNKGRAEIGASRVSTMADTAKRFWSLLRRA